MFKKSAAFALVTLALTLSGAALAGEVLVPSALVSATLTRWSIDSQLSYADQVQAASISVDALHQEVTLLLVRKSHCPPNQLCIAMMPAPVIVRLPIVNTTTTRCGSVVITARADNRPVDGVLQEVVIRDNSGYNCPYFNLLAASSVSYKTSLVERETATEISTLSQFQGEALRGQN